MQTGIIESWTVNPAEMGPLYPFVGYEVLFVVVGVVFWIAFTIWQLKSENADYLRREEELKHPEKLHAAIKNDFSI